MFVVERGGGYPVIVLHGGPGLDHHAFADYLDPLAERYRLVYVDQRAQGRSDPAPESTWTLEHMAADVGLVAESLELDRYAVLGHSYGAFVALQHAVDVPERDGQTILSAGVPSARFLEVVDRNLETFEPIELREQVSASWAREEWVETPEECRSLWLDQLPFHFGDPLDPRIHEYARRIEGIAYAPAVLRHFAREGYGGIEVEDRLKEISYPVLMLAGRLDRACPVEAADALANGIPRAEIVVFERSAHFAFVEEQDAYLEAVRGFLRRHEG